MKQVFTLLAIFASTLCFSQANNQTIFSKVTATWCINCGTWGWGFMEDVKDEFKERDHALVLGVHYSGNLKSDVGVWWTNNLNSVGQPTFYLNEDRVSVNSGNWGNKISEVVQSVDGANGSTEGLTRLEFTNAFINANGEIETNMIVGPGETLEYDEYFGVYIFENDVVDVQSGHSGTVLHPNVLRTVIGDNPEGQAFGDAGSSWVAEPAQLHFTHPVEENWDTENLGLLAVWWEKIGDDFVIKQAHSIENIGLLSSTENTLDEGLFTISSTENNINLKSSKNDNYKYFISELSGKVINQGHFKSQTKISSINMATGMYIVNIRREDKFFTKKIFVK